MITPDYIDLKNTNVGKPTEESQDTKGNNSHRESRTSANTS